MSDTNQEVTQKTGVVNGDIVEVIILGETQLPAYRKWMQENKPDAKMSYKAGGIQFDFAIITVGDIIENKYIIRRNCFSSTREFKIPEYNVFGNFGQMTPSQIKRYKVTDMTFSVNKDPEDGFNRTRVIPNPWEVAVWKDGQSKPTMRASDITEEMAVNNPDYMRCIENEKKRNTWWSDVLKRYEAMSEAEAEEYLRDIVSRRYMCFDKEHNLVPLRVGTVFQCQVWSRSEKNYIDLRAFKANYKGIVSIYSGLNARNSEDTVLIADGINELKANMYKERKEQVEEEGDDTPPF